MNRKTALIQTVSVKDAMNRIRNQRSYLARFQVKQVLRLLLPLLLNIKLLSACTARPVTLSFVVPQDEVSYWLPLISEFEAQHSNVLINLINTDKSNLDKPTDTDELKEFYLSSLKRRSSYDLVYLDIVWLPEFAQAGLLKDLTKEFTKQDLEHDFLNSEVQAGYFDDRLYRIPFRTDGGVLFYRRDLLENLYEDKYDREPLDDEVPPQTFEALLTLSRQLKQAGKVQYGYLWQGRKTEALTAMFVEILEGYGGFWINTETDKVGLSEDSAIDAVEFLRKTLREDISPKMTTKQNEEQTRNLFRQGEAAFMRNWPSAWVEVSTGDSRASGNIAIAPMVHVKGERSGSCQGGWGFAIAEDTPHKQEALEAVKFFTSASAQRQFTLTFGAAPSRRALFNDPEIVSRYRHYPELLEIMEKYWVARPRMPEYAKASCILKKYLSQALENPKSDRKNLEGIMNNAARETRQLLKDGTSSCSLQ